jgi:hypothetical protein
MLRQVAAAPHDGVRQLMRQAGLKVIVRTENPVCGAEAADT